MVNYCGAHLPRIARIEREFWWVVTGTIDWSMSFTHCQVPLRLSHPIPRP
jgi:hypothetical protein